MSLSTLKNTQEEAQIINLSTYGQEIAQELDIDNLNCLGLPNANNAEEANEADKMFEPSPRDLDKWFAA